MHRTLKYAKFLNSFIVKLRSQGNISKKKFNFLLKIYIYFKNVFMMQKR